MNVIVRFLLARIADDERELRRSLKSPSADPSSVARRLNEAGAKRDVIGIAQRMFVLRDLPLERPVRDGAEEIVRRLAAVYAEHRDYRAEWRPTPGRIIA
jgi:hypothetical protein